MTVRCGNLQVSNIAELTHFHEWKTQQKRKGTMDVCAICTEAFFYFVAYVALKPLVVLVGCMIVRDVRLELTDRYTHTHTLTYTHTHTLTHTHAYCG